MALTAHTHIHGQTLASSILNFFQAVSDFENKHAFLRHTEGAISRLKSEASQRSTLSEIEPLPVIHKRALPLVSTSGILTANEQHSFVQGKAGGSDAAL